MTQNVNEQNKMHLIKYNFGIHDTCNAVNGTAFREFQFVIKVTHYMMCYNFSSTISICIISICIIYIYIYIYSLSSNGETEEHAGQ
jgi:hypothetical protein